MDEYISDNKIAWESIAPIHSKGLVAKRERIINNECFIPISDGIINYLSNINVVSKTCLHLCCNNGF